MKSSEPVTKKEFYAEAAFVRSEFRSVRDAIQGIHDKIACLIEKIWNLELRMAKAEEKIANDMMTKADGQRILDHIDAWAHRIETYDRKAVIQDYRLNQHETRIANLESHRH